MDNMPIPPKEDLTKPLYPQPDENDTFILKGNQYFINFAKEIGSGSQAFLY